MIEVRGTPPFGRVAIRTICQGKSGTGTRVHGIVRLLPRCQVAAGRAAGSRRDLQIVIVVDVARGARHVGVPVGQQETCGAVIELGVQPGVKGVASFAARREIGAGVVGIRRFLKIFQMARGARRGKTLILTDCGAFVAVLAWHGGVGAKEWETILVILDLLDGDLPSANGVALRAVRAEFPAMNVCVAIGAILSHIGENRFHMALDALYLFVHASQRVVGFVVIKLGHSTDWSPARSCMAVFARNGKRTVRTAGAFPLSKPAGSKQSQY